MPKEYFPYKKVQQQELIAALQAVQLPHSVQHLCKFLHLYREHITNLLHPVLKKNLVIYIWNVMMLDFQ